VAYDKILTAHFFSLQSLAVDISNALQKKPLGLTLTLLQTLLQQDLLSLHCVLGSDMHCLDS